MVDPRPEASGQVNQTDGLEHDDRTSAPRQMNWRGSCRSRVLLVVFKNEERNGCVKFSVRGSLLLLHLIPLLIQREDGIKSEIRSRSKTSARRFEAKLR